MNLDSVYWLSSQTLIDSSVNRSQGASQLIAMRPNPLMKKYLADVLEPMSMHGATPGIIDIHSHSGTPTRSGTPVSQPVFQPSVGFNEGHRHLPAPLPDHPPYGDDPFRVNPAAEGHCFISLNDDDEMSQMQMPAGRNAALMSILNVQGGAGPLSQEGQLFEWQLGPPPALPGPPVPQPNPPPVPQPSPPPASQPNSPAPSQNLPLDQPPPWRVAGAQQNPARQEHPQFSDRIWCTKGRHWVLKTVFGNLMICNGCRATNHTYTTQLQKQQAALAAVTAAELQLGAQIGENVPQTKYFWGTAEIN
ncbi:hypothetical protein PILCRDRAFT_854 [Piloderma croceum F 1598]|uniref:Uncharacterized protein n=1 Tax=Piloderma croceum (strain F 1598) TaxID=765440 RepID=A0A0C3CPX7_PILCF|nr:hypothetical protein PILCRDRAFT_854 [Piloderma croceum F 1598]